MPAPVDLRSDTVTRPTDEMRRAMAAAEVGDDGYGEDPTVRELEEAFAAWVGKPAAVFVPSGVMANQIALRVLFRPGDVVLAGELMHVVGFELGAAGRNAGVLFHTLDDGTGLLEPAAVAEAVGASKHHQPEVGGMVLENTHMASGGTPLDAATTAASIEAVAGRPVHLDGARLWNATVALDVPAATLAERATTVMSCLSKGLCAPVGSLLAGPSDVIEAGRVERKRLGGAMRQAGVLAAAGLVAMRTMLERLAEDHRRARRLADAVQSTVAPGYDATSCRTNVVCFEVHDADEVCRRLQDLGVLAGSLTATRVRLVTHRDVDDAQVDAAVDALATLGSAAQPGR